MPFPSGPSKPSSAGPSKPSSAAATPGNHGGGVRTRSARNPGADGVAGFPVVSNILPSAESFTPSHPVSPTFSPPSRFLTPLEPKIPGGLLSEVSEFAKKLYEHLVSFVPLSRDGEGTMAFFPRTEATMAIATSLAETVFALKQADLLPFPWSPADSDDPLELPLSRIDYDRTAIPLQARPRLAVQIRAAIFAALEGRGPASKR